MPLILHNVPDDELYVGEDGVQRPYAMIFSAHEQLPPHHRQANAPARAPFSLASFSTHHATPPTAPSGSLPAPDGISSAAEGSTSTPVLQHTLSTVSQAGGGATGASTRRVATLAETGAFGRSTRRSRSRTGTPGPGGGGSGVGGAGVGGAGGRGGREDPTLVAAERVLAQWRGGFAGSGRAGTPAPEAGAGTGLLEGVGGMEGAGEELAGEGAAGPAAGGAPGAQTAAPRPPPPTINAVPTEVILSGFRSADTQYAAIARFEALAGRICEDYPREPPPGTGRRRYGGVLRESVGFGAYSASPTAARRRNHGPATAEERAKVARVAGGEHWIKVTFESAEAAEAAVYASPQSVLGCLVSAELYHGRPPARDEVVWDEAALLNGGEETTETVPTTPSTPKRRGGATAARRAFGLVDQLSPESSTSGTIETATMSSTTVAGGGGSVVPVGGAPETPGGWAAEPSTAVEPVTPGRSTAIEPQTPGTAARRRPAGARKLALLPAEQALLPQPSMAARVLNRIPFLKWFSGSMIGNEVPRTESGEFDWARASLYWKVVAWLDSVLGLFGGEVVGVDRDD